VQELSSAESPSFRPSHAVAVFEIQTDLILYLAYFSWVDASGMVTLFIANHRRPDFLGRGAAGRSPKKAPEIPDLFNANGLPNMLTQYARTL
jgi:hypothetical protein